MRGLGRLFALPWLLIALAVQALAPAAAAAMWPVAASPDICSAQHELGGSRRPDPAKPRDHDCCAFACAVANLAAAPPAQLGSARVAFAVPARLAPPRAAHGLRASPLDQPRARGPPARRLTI
jgi:hypothetical protein